MGQGDDRWVEVSRSAFAHETDGLSMLRYVVPQAAPYRAWTNFEFMDNHGQWHEVDALVLGRRRLHLVELKHYTGVLQGSETSWVRTTPGGRPRTQRSPLLLTRRKAQRLATRIEEEARKVALEHGLDVEKVKRALPFVQESVFLHGSPFRVEMPELAKSGLFGPDGFENETGLPGISTRLLEPPTDARRVNEELSVIIALALRNLGIARRTERDAGSWTITGTPLASGDNWQEWSATHKGAGEPGRARVVSFNPGTPAQAAAHRGCSGSSRCCRRCGMRRSSRRTIWHWPTCPPRWPQKALWHWRRRHPLDRAPEHNPRSFVWRRTAEEILGYLA